MGGDYSRITFKPNRDYTGVLKQQGRVGLEADHNELVEILGRRWRAESIDIMSRCAVPISNPANQTAFEILPSGPATFTIGRGRMYVDGLQIECRGDPQSNVEYDASLGEERWANPLPYNQQPWYYPNNPSLPDPPGSQAGVTDLVYVDAWEREVTAIEDPDIREIALGGPDTATRVQIVWQVRVLKDVGLHSCGDLIGKWSTLTTPTTGRLTTAAVQPPASDDPCVLSPTGGYRGLENRLYRVEIHDGGALGPGGPSFKWSRDNGSILTRVEDIPAANQLKVQRISRDAVLRFSIGDWVEVSDDPTEFALKVGHLALVTNVDEANRILTIDTPIPAAFGFNATIASRHTRVRRWDGKADLVAGATNLEDGVQITFGVANGDTFKSGDYWVFAARTADGSVEQLQNAPPRGIQHHYCRLALITWGNPPQRVDCREFWPAEGCCTEVVWPGEDIQSAIDRLPVAGGCVCLKPGIHKIVKPLTISKSNVTLHGETIGAVIQSDTSNTLLMIASTNLGPADNVTVHDIRFETLGPAYGEIISIWSAVNTVVRECALVVSLNRNDRAVAYGIGVTGAISTATIAMNEMSGVMIGVIAIGAQRVDVIRNTIDGAVMRLTAGITPVGLLAVMLVEVLDPCLIEENTLTDFQIGIYLGQRSSRSIIARNRIVRSLTTGMAPKPMSYMKLIFDPPFYAIDCAAPATIIADNSMNTANEFQGGVRVTGWTVRVEGNRIISELKDWVQPPPRAVFIEAPNDQANVSGVVVRGNLLMGPQTGIEISAVSATGADRLQIINNLYRGFRVPPGLLTGYGIAAANAKNSLIAGNEIEACPVGIALGGQSATVGNRLLGNRIAAVNLGILGGGQHALAVADNTIDGASVVGIVGIGCVSAAFSNSTITAASIGIFSSGGVSTVIRANSIADGIAGIIAYKDIDFIVDGNTIENMGMWGIATADVVGATARHNRVAWCAYQTIQGSSIFAAAIVQANTPVSATIEACDVTDTGRSRDGTTLSAQDTFSIVQIGLADSHVRANRIANADGLSAKFQHGGILLFLGVHAEILDNVVTGTGTQPLINVLGLVFRLLTGDVKFRFADVICSGNRCVQTVPAGLNVGTGTASIVVAAERLTSVGNQVRATDPNYPSFDTSNTDFVSATGNITSGDWVPAGGLTFVPALLTANHIRI